MRKSQMKDVRAMGLAAGGKLVQDIYKDPYPARIWNHAAARILHVHILDPESCEKVTHIVPKPPPIDVREYTETGAQFFVIEEKVDDRLDGGDFDNVKSASQMDEHIGISTEPEFDLTKPKMCTTCEIRLCDCIIRPCDHQFCNVCIRRIDQSDDTESESQDKRWKCPTCDSAVSRVAGISAPMNLPGEEPLRTKVPVNVLKIEDGRMRFSSVQRSRV